MTFALISIRTRIGIYSYQEKDTNEYPNTFVQKEILWIGYKWIFVLKMIRKFEYSNICHSLTEYDLIQTNIQIYLYQENDTTKYPNIFVSKKFIWTNIPTNICIENIQIFEGNMIFITG